MANVAFHMAAGLGLGAALTIAPVVRAWTSDARRARPIGRMLVAATLCGFLAVIPNVLRWLGLTEGLLQGALANAFVLHPAINRVQSQGMLIGHMLMALFFIGSYLLLLVAIVSTRRRISQANRPADTPS